MKNEVIIIVVIINIIVTNKPVKHISWHCVYNDIIKIENNIRI